MYTSGLVKTDDAVNTAITLHNSVRNQWRILNGVFRFKVVYCICVIRT